jgi:asparagine N-glycosylation enzyme membrane subunit Stt3
MRKFWRSKWFVVAILLTIVLVVASTLLALRITLGEREDAVLKYFFEQEGMPQTFEQLRNLTEPDSVVLCWWDYGRAVRGWSNREVIEAYPSRDIWESIAASRDPWHNLAAQLFGTWGSSERIHDLADIFMLPEEQALPLMSKYDVSYALVFTPDDLQKFNWIAEIAGYTASEYLTVEDDVYQPTELGSHVTLLRLLFDDTFHSQYFTKIFDNSKGKIYRVDYP